MVTDGQVRTLRRLLDQGTPLGQAARRTGMSDKTARQYRDDPTLPSVRRNQKPPRTYRTRLDPFAAVWPEVEGQLRAEPKLTAKTLFDWLRQRHPGQFFDSHRRTFERRVRRYVAPHLLVIDELGYVPADGRAADVLYHVINARHELRSTIITTNLAYKQWTSIFPNAACVGALVDRFVQHCHAIEIDADSWRAKTAEQFKKPRGRPKPTA